MKPSTKLSRKNPRVRILQRFWQAQFKALHKAIK